MANDPCLSSLAATSVTASGRGRVVSGNPAANPKIDCFYVYPTVSNQPTANADLTVDPEETAVAVAQASRFSQVCNVYAPVYRQLTKAAVAGTVPVTSTNDTIAFAGVLNAWKYYLAHDNHGRGVAFIGHSQGASMLVALLKYEVDPVASLRAQLVSAILLGGNLTVPVGKLEGGTFSHIPLCTNVNAPGCVIAYSSYSTTPPVNSIFGRLSSPVGALSAPPSIDPQQVACVNPVAGTTPALPATTSTTAPSTTAASVTGSAGPLIPYFPTQDLPSPVLGSPKPGRTAIAVSTPWVTFPRLYQASCISRGGATWLQVTDIAKPGDVRPVVQDTLGPAWGLHEVDINIALGNLVSDLQHQALRYGR
jgi:hypothetical protein